MGTVYDVVVVGAGSSGCALAYRLAASSDLRVLLVEAGGPAASPLWHIPLGFAFLLKEHKGNWNYYYLYGLERVGSLTRVEQMGTHWWYVEGARHLLAKQDKKGFWPGGDVQTAFALLFLRRATSGKASMTGGYLGVFVAVGLVSWVGVYRTVRAEVLRLRELDRPA